MLLSLTLAAGLLAAPESQPDLQKGWVVEIRGYTYHRQVDAEGWIFEVRDFVKHPDSERPPVQVEPLETIYVEDLPAFLKRLRER